jgi:hypothetical protein
MKLSLYTKNDKQVMYLLSQQVNSKSLQHQMQLIRPPEVPLFVNTIPERSDAFVPSWH